VDRGELVVHYQPVVDLRSGRISRRVEALVRWQHPERGLLVARSEFIGVAEDIGTIGDLGRHVLEVAVASVSGARSAAQRDRPFQLGVNISGPPAQRPASLDRRRRNRCSTRLRLARPSRLLLEITESGLLIHGVSTARSTR
jgi:EAL domain-containing protein (putative c-di-GMP-specific phosphodiesterase class I)